MSQQQTIHGMRVVTVANGIEVFLQQGAPHPQPMDPAKVFVFQTPEQFTSWCLQQSWPITPAETA